MKSGRSSLLWLLLAFFFLPVLPSLGAGPIHLGNNLGLDPPTGWEYVGGDDQNVTFAPSGEGGYLRLKIYEGDTWDDADTMVKDLIELLAADEQQTDAFSYRGRNARFSDILIFPGDGIAFHGYLIAIEGARLDIVLMALTDPDRFSAMSTVLLSGLDSFSMSDDDRLRPGPVTSYLFGENGGEKRLSPFTFEDSNESLVYDSVDIEAAAWVIEREANLLVTYAGTPLAAEAWQRYYRIIYRDSYHRLDPLYRLLDRVISRSDNEDGLTQREIASRLLGWVQGFSYRRSGGVSDLDGPLAVAVSGEGDCDSRGLLLAAVLNHFGIDSVLMVSDVYGHSLVGTDVTGNGARFSFGGKNYLVAETTAKVAIGMIDESMADPAKWIGIDFFRYSR